MHIDRRTAVKNFLIISAGIAFIPSCMQQKGKPSIVLKNIDITLDEENLLAEVCETFIPATNTPGAKDIAAHLFALKMLDDCTSEKNQQKIIKGMRQFDELADKKFGKTFLKCDSGQRQELFGMIENKKGISEEVISFYAAFKSLTIQAYTTSKYYMTNIEVYELIPGRFHGCFPLNKAKVI